jgi:membrane protease YdiL (CAAX protease family)
MNFDTKKQIVIGLLFTLVFPTLMIRRSEDELASVRHLIVYELIWWAAAAAVLLYVLFAERRLLSSVGYRRPGLRGLGIAIAAGIVLMAGLALIFYVALPALHLDMTQQASKLLALPLSWRLILVARGVVAEELFYRGYAIERLQELTRSRAIAGIFSGAFFTFAHVATWGWAQLLFAGFAAIILTLLYLWRRNLWVNMITHAVVDGVGVLAA